jgi:arylsulfatase A-like enzyme
MRFTDCYAGSTVCAPSRSVLMTGQHTGHTTVRGNFGKFGVRGLAGNEGRVPLYAADVTVAEVLKEAGYVTGITGKWGLGEPNTSGHPNDQGFDEWFGYLNQGTYTHDLFTEFALDFIDRHEQDPFFLYLPYTVPHSRYEIPDTAPYSDQTWEEKEKVHAAMITRLDRDIGAIFDRLKERGLDENTIVFFCSDNGAAERWEGRFDSSGALQGRKRDMYEGGLRTPMIVRWPGKVAANAISDLPWYFADVLPTLADLGDANIPEKVDGVSVLPTLLGKRQDLGDRAMYWEFFERGFQQAVRLGKWKAVRLALDKPIELYDLSIDIGETNNVAAQHPEVVKQMESIMKTSRSPSENWPVDALD